MAYLVFHRPGAGDAGQGGAVAVDRDKLLQDPSRGRQGCSQDVEVDGGELPGTEASGADQGQAQLTGGIPGWRQIVLAEVGAGKAGGKGHDAIEHLACGIGGKTGPLGEGQQQIDSADGVCAGGAFGSQQEASRDAADLGKLGAGGVGDAGLVPGTGEEGLRRPFEFVEVWWERLPFAVSSLDNSASTCGTDCPPSAASWHKAAKARVLV